MKHSTRAACHANIPRLQNLERHERRIHQVPQFTGEESEALAAACRLSVDARLISLAPVLGHRARDGIVQASVQRPKLVGADRRVQFHGQFGDGLAHIAVVVHDLRYREPLTQEVMSVLDRAPADLGARPLAELSDFQPAELSDFDPALTARVKTGRRVSFCGFDSFESRNGSLVRQMTHPG